MKQLMELARRLNVCPDAFKRMHDKSARTFDCSMAENRTIRHHNRSTNLLHIELEPGNGYNPVKISLIHADAKRFAESILKDLA